MDATFVKPKHAAFGAAATAYVAAGFLAFQLIHALTQDAELANTIVAVLAVPLAAPLYAALRWIDGHL